MRDCKRCKGRGTIPYGGDNWTTTVEAAALYEQRHAGAPSRITCKDCAGTGLTPTYRLAREVAERTGGTVTDAGSFWRIETETN